MNISLVKDSTQVHDDLVPLTLLENEADAGAISSIQFNSLIKKWKDQERGFTYYLEVGRYP